MKRPRKDRQQRPCLVRVGAMERPRDVRPGFVPVQFLDPEGGEPVEWEVPARVVDAHEALARREGITLERMIERVVVEAARRDAREGR